MFILSLFFVAINIVNGSLDIWKDGDGRHHVGQPSNFEIWKDGDGRHHVGQPSKFEIWKDGDGKYHIG